MHTRVCALAHINRLQSYKKKLTYTIVYAIFSHFLYFFCIFLQVSKIFCIFAPKIYQLSSIIYTVYNTNENACKN